MMGAEEEESRPPHAREGMASMESAGMMASMEMESTGAGMASMERGESAGTMGESAGMMDAEEEGSGGGEGEESLLEGSGRAEYTGVRPPSLLFFYYSQA